MPDLPTEKSISSYATIIGFVITIISAYIAIDSHYAKAEAVKQIEWRLTQKIVADRSDRIQERIWRFETQYPDRTKAPQGIQEQWKILEKELTMNDVLLRKSITEDQLK